MLDCFGGKLVQAHMEKEKQKEKQKEKEKEKKSRKIEKEKNITEKEKRKGCGRRPMLQVDRSRNASLASSKLSPILI